MPDAVPPAASPPRPGQLERGEVGVWPACPFFAPAGADRENLLNPLRAHLGTKDVSFDPATRRFSGRRPLPAAVATGLQEVLTRFSAAAQTWLAETFPEYAPGLTPDRVTWHGNEEATRRLRHTARNDLLHIDNFPTRPTHGRRILRLFMNVHPADPQVWGTSERFPELLARYRARHSVPVKSEEEWLAVGGRWRRLFRAGWAGRSEYDAMMLRVHHFLKNDPAFQMRAARRLWTFPPGSAWLAFTDSLSYAWLRGRQTLEQSFFVSQAVLREPGESPLARLCRAEAPSSLAMTA